MHVIEGDELLSKEQEMLDEHDNKKAKLAIRIKRLVSLCTSTPDSNFHKIASCKLTRIGKSVSSIVKAIGSLPGSSDDVCLLHQHEEQLCDHKELGDIRDSIYILSKELVESDELISLQAQLEK